MIVCLLTIMQTCPTYAENVSDEWYEMVDEEFEMPGVDAYEISPYKLYLIDVITSLAKLGSGKVGLRADVYCAATMPSITITFYLQKSNGSSWVNVASGTASATNVSRTAKSKTVSGLSSGTYRAKAVVLVRDSSGYAESLTGYSGSLTI